MSFTTLAWVLMYVIALVGAPLNPLLGLLGYMLEYFQRPSLHWWGRGLPDLRWNFTIAAVAGGAYVLRRLSLQPFRRTRNIFLILLTLQAVNTTLVTLWAVDPVQSWRWSVQYWKLVPTFILFSGIVRTPQALDVVILFQLLNAGYWGYEAIGAERTNTRLEGIGSSDTMNSNLLAAHLLTIIPLGFIVVLKKHETWIRVVALVALAYSLNLFILANSRGAFLGFVAAGAASFVLVERGMRTRIAVGSVIGALALYLVADPQFIERQQTIVSADDGSAQSRLDLWRGSIRMVADYPFGAGGRGYHRLSPLYVPELQESNDGEGRSSHNTYVQVVVEWGIQGLVLFLAFIILTFRMLQQIRRERGSPDWVYFVSLGLQLGLVGTFVAAFFSNRFFGESIYWMCGLSLALYRMTSPEERAVESGQPKTAAAA